MGKELFQGNNVQVSRHEYSDPLLDGNHAELPGIAHPPTSPEK